MPEIGGRTIVALCRRGGPITWTLLRIRRDGRPLGPPETRTVDAPPIPPDAAPDVGAAALRPALAGLRGEATLVLPADHALLRILDLPTTDPAELASMVELQLDRFSPFPTDHLVAAYEILGVEEGRTRVLVAAVQRAVVEREAALLAGTGLDVRRADLDAMGWWRHLAGAGETERAGLRIHLNMEPDSMIVLAVHNGRPVLLRALGRGLDRDTPAEIEDEVNLTLTTLETEWSLTSDATLVVWFPGEPDPTWAGRLGEACGLPVESASISDLPPLTEGIVQRTLDDPTRVLNLAPAEWEAARRARSLTRRFTLSAAACFGLWLLIVGGFLAALAVREANIQRLARHVDVLEKPAAEVRVLQGRVRSLEDYSDRSRSALEILRQVSQDLPAGLTLTSFSVRKGRTVSLRGEADAVNAVYDFFSALEKSGLFKEVKPEGVTSKPSSGRARSEFRVTATLPGEEAAS